MQDKKVPWCCKALATAEEVHEPAVPAVIAEEARRQKPPVELVIVDDFEQVTKPRVTVENVSVDEVTPQADSATSEDFSPEPASPDRTR